MNFNGSVLMQWTGDQYRTHWLEQGGPPLILDDEGTDLEHRVQEAMEDYMDDVGMAYIDRFSQGNGWVNCPEGRNEVPADTWQCKITKKTCPIQAQIRLHDKDGFVQGCNLDDHAQNVRAKHGVSPREHKEKLWHAIKQGKYEGHHHLPGTVPCDFCDDPFREKYYFPWELTRLSHHITDYDAARRSPELIRHDIAYKLGNVICADCFTSLAESPAADELQSHGINLEHYQCIEFTYTI